MIFCFFSSNLQTSGRAYNLDRLLWKSADGLHKLSALTSNRNVQPGQSLCYSPPAVLWAQKHLCTCHVSKETELALTTHWVATLSYAEADTGGHALSLSKLVVRRAVGHLQCIQSLRWFKSCMLELTSHSPLRRRGKDIIFGSAIDYF